MRNIGVLIFTAATLLNPGSDALAQGATPFDGEWNVTLECPFHEGKANDAKGYRYQFPAEVKNGALRGSQGREGEPSWFFLTGTIAPDGTATLKADGIVGNQSSAANNAQRGTPYTYRVRARFERDKGTGERIGTRKCDFTFVRR
jgi:hypothetical protein